MKRIMSLIIIIAIALTLGACKKKSQEDIVKKLGEQLEKVDKFNVDAVMEIKENNKAHVFDVNVKYKAPNMYKVTLKNRDSNNVQMILKNGEGVYVLTPALNKSFRFQSDWPLNSSQPYLYQSLVKDIVNDKDRVYVKQDGNHVFETKVDYRRSSDLVTQKIILSAKTMFPKEVIVLDSTNNQRIKVLFGDVNYKPKFNDKEFEVDFSMNTALNSYRDVLPTFIERSIMYPTYLEQGTRLLQETIKDVSHGKRAIMTFGGTNTFTLVEEFVNIKEELDVQIIYGDPVLTVNGIAFLTETSLTWHNNGIEFLIISDTLNADQIYKIANSMMSEGKK